MTTREPIDDAEARPAQPGVPLAPPGIAPESDVRVHTPAAAAPLPAHGVVNDGLGELPQCYGDGRLVALVRDPATLFIYWDFSPAQREQAFAGLGNARAVARLCHARTPDVLREVELHLETHGWYLRDLPPGAELRVELWAVGERGSRMLRAARPVKLPPAQPSDLLEAVYIRIPLSHSLRDGIPRNTPLQYGGAAPHDWDRRIHPREAELQSSHGPIGSSPGQRLPWSVTHVPDLDQEP